MTSTSILITHFSILCFSLSTVFFFAFSYRNKNTQKDAYIRISSFFFNLGILASLISWGDYFTKQGDLHSVLFFSISVLAIFSSYLLLHKKNLNMSIVSLAFIASLTILLKLESYETEAYTLAHGNSVLFLHVIGAIIGELFAFLAAISSCFFLLQSYLLKEKRLRIAFKNKIPALDRLEYLLIWSIIFGFLFFTIALVSGTVYLLSTSNGENFNLGIYTKIIWSFSVWVAYFLALIARSTFGVSTKTLSKIGIGGFTLLGGAYFGFIF